MHIIHYTHCAFQTLRAAHHVWFNLMIVPVPTSKLARSVSSLAAISLCTSSHSFSVGFSVRRVLPRPRAVPVPAQVPDALPGLPSACQSLALPPVSSAGGGEGVRSGVWMKLPSGGFDCQSPDHTGIMIGDKTGSHPVPGVHTVPQGEHAVLCSAKIQISLERSPRCDAFPRYCVLFVLAQ